MKNITTDALRRMTDSEGLILQGCGGDLNEWVDSINELLTQEKILLDGDTFKEVSVFEYDGCTNLLFHLDNIKLDVNKLAMWRIQSHSAFYGVWLSDFVNNRLGGFINTSSQTREKPDCALLGQNGNIFNLLGIASQTLNDHEMRDEAVEMRRRVMDSGSYAHL